MTRPATLVTLVLAFSLVGAILVSGTAQAARQDVYLGTPTELPLGWDNGDGDGYGFGDSWTWSWYANPGDGILRAYAQADDTDDGDLTYASAGAGIWDEIEIVRRCDGQVRDLEATLTLVNPELIGALTTNQNGDQSTLNIRFNLDGDDVNNKPVDWEYDVFDGDSKSFDAESINIPSLTPNADIGDTWEPAVGLEVNPASEQGGQGTADFSTDFDSPSSRSDGLYIDGVRIDFPDSSPPSMIIEPQGKVVDGYHESPTPVEVRYEDPQTCVQHVEVSADDGTSVSKDPGFGQDPVNIEVDGETGTHTVDAEATNYQESTSQESASFEVDASPPTTTASDTCDGETTESGACDGDVTVSFSCSDVQVDCENGDTIHYRVDRGDEQTGSSTTITDPGEHTVEYWGIDQLDNVESSNSITVEVVDNTPPEIVLGCDDPAGDNGWYTKTPVACTAEASDVSGVAETCVRVDGDTRTCDTSDTVTAELDTNGVHTVRGCAEDNEGNFGCQPAEDQPGKEVPIDTLVPDRVSLNDTACSTGPAGYCNGTVHPTWEFCADDSGASGLGAWEFDPTNFTTSPPDLSGEEETCDTTTVDLGDGIYPLTVRAEDVAGNQGPWSEEVEVRVDATGPDITEHEMNCPKPGNDGWCRSQDANVSVVATDSLQNGVRSGTESVGYVFDGGEPQQERGADTDIPVRGDGVFDLEAWGVDQAQNEGPSISEEIRVDSTPPETTDEPNTQPQGDDGWYTSFPTITVSGSDPGEDASGLQSVACELDGVVCKDHPDAGADALSPGWELTLLDGIFALNHTGTDVAGNEESSEGATQYKVDTTPPGAGPEIEGQEGNNGWYKSDVTVRLNPSDRNDSQMHPGEASGVSHCEMSLDQGFPDDREPPCEMEVSSDGNHTIDYVIEDNATNRAPERTLKVKVDQTAPRTSIERPAGPILPRGEPVTIGVNGSDPNDVSGFDHHDVFVRNVTTTSDIESDWWHVCTINDDTGTCEVVFEDPGVVKIRDAGVDRAGNVGNTTDPYVVGP